MECNFSSLQVPLRQLRLASEHTLHSHRAMSLRELNAFIRYHFGVGACRISWLKEKLFCVIFQTVATCFMGQRKSYLANWLWSMLSDQWTVQIPCIYLGKQWVYETKIGEWMDCERFGCYCCCCCYVIECKMHVQDMLEHNRIDR